MSDIVIQTNNITKQYGGYIAVDNVNITVKKGEIYGLVGKNGAGKTTLLRMICGLTLPKSGEIEIMSKTSEKGLNEARSRTGCMIETPNFFSYLSARKNLEYYRIQRGIPGEKCVDEVLDVVGLSSADNKKYKSFSLGMKQRLGLALTLMGNPDILILDEPINGLDPMGIAEFREIIKNINEKYNATVLISSHILGELSQIATTYGFINNGKLIEQISAEELYNKCRLCVSVKVDDTSKAATILENKLKCTEYEVLNNNEIRVFKYVEKPEVITEALVFGGVKVASIYPVGASLEKYFIDLVGDDRIA